MSQEVNRACLDGQECLWESLGCLEEAFDHLSQLPLTDDPGQQQRKRLLSTQLISTALLKALRVSLLLSACCRSSCMLRHYAGGLTRKPSKLHGVSKHDNERYTGLLRLSQVCKMMCEHCNAEMSH